MAGLGKESGQKDRLGDAASNRLLPEIGFSFRGAFLGASPERLFLELGFVSWRVDCFGATSKRPFPELGFKSEANFRLEAPTARKSERKKKRTENELTDPVLTGL